MTEQEFLETAKGLRREADEAETRFMEFLWEGEQQDFWKASGQSYIEFLEHHDICKATRYVRYMRVRKSLGTEEIAGVGYHAIHAAGAHHSPELQREVISEAKAWEKTNATAISAQSAERISRSVKSRTTGARSRHASWEALHDENARLKEKVRKLEEENRVLKAELKTAKETTKRKRDRRASV